MCGMTTTPKNTRKARANGTGTVVKLSNHNYKAVVVIGYKDPTHPVRRTKSGFKTRKEALEYIPILKQQTATKVKDATLKEIYDLWEPTHERSKQTLNCYRAAMIYFKSLLYVKFRDIGIDDWQKCIDSCPHGARTKENMRTIAGLLYKYAIPRGYTNDDKNLAQYLKIYNREKARAKESFTDAELDKIKAACGVVDYADYIYCLCYSGYRPNEFLALKIEDYNRKESCFVGGGKTEAGTNRTVTISPKIAQIVDRIVGNRISGYVFCDKNNRRLSVARFREGFYSALDDIGIDNPIIDNTRKYTPHSCRHTFATLVKRVKAPDKDKLALMGHTSEEMLRYYQDVKYDDLRKITDKL